MQRNITDFPTKIYLALQLEAKQALYAWIEKKEVWHLCLQGLLQSGTAPANLLRWYEFVASQPEVAKVLKSLPAESKAQPVSGAAKSATNGQAKQIKEEGKFVDLPNAEMGKVMVRFPPEASG